MAHCTFSSGLLGRWQQGSAPANRAAAASLPGTLPSRRPSGPDRSERRSRRRSASDAQPPPAPKIGGHSEARPQIVNIDGCEHAANDEVRTDWIRRSVDVLYQMVEWALGEESDDDDAEAVLVFIIRTSESRFRVGGRPGESVADLLTRVVCLAMMPEHGGLGGASVRVCTSCGRALAAGMSLREVKSRELMLDGSAPDGKASFDGYAENVEDINFDDKAGHGNLQPECASEEGLSTSFVQDPDLGPAVLISAAGSRPRAGSETLLCTLQF